MPITPITVRIVTTPERVGDALEVILKIKESHPDAVVSVEVTMS